MSALARRLGTPRPGASSSPASRPTGAGASRRRSRASSRSTRSSASTRASRTRELERTEYVKVSNQHSLLQRIVRAARDRHGHRHAPGRQLADGASARATHENNVIGTMNILAACTRQPTRRCGSSSSRARRTTTAAEQDDPAFFTETMSRPHPPRTRARARHRRGRAAVSEFAARRNPDVDGDDPALRERPRPGRRHRVHPDVPRCPRCRWSSASIPRLQFVHEDDVVHALEHAAFHVTPGIYNVAADGVLALSEVHRPGGRRSPRRSCRRGAPGSSRAPLRRLGFRIPVEIVNLLRFGRGVDNRLFKATGFDVRLHDARGRDQALASTCASRR